MKQSTNLHMMKHATKELDPAMDLAFCDANNRIVENERVTKELERAQAIQFAMLELTRVRFCLLDNAPECADVADAFRPAMHELQKMLEVYVRRAREQGHDEGERLDV